jgi:hypothetical protein
MRHLLVRAAAAASAALLGCGTPAGGTDARTDDIDQGVSVELDEIHVSSARDGTRALWRACR